MAAGNPNQRGVIGGVGKGPSHAARDRSVLRPMYEQDGTGDLVHFADVVEAVYYTTRMLHPRRLRIVSITSPQRAMQPPLP